MEMISHEPMAVDTLSVDTTLHLFTPLSVTEEKLKIQLTKITQQKRNSNEFISVENHSKIFVQKSIDQTRIPCS